MILRQTLFGSFSFIILIVEGLIYQQAIPFICGYILTATFLIIYILSYIFSNVENSCYFLACGLGSSLSEVNFLTVQGASTSDSFVAHSGILATRLPFIGVSLIIVCISPIALKSIMSLFKNNIENRHNFLFLSSFVLIAVITIPFILISIIKGNNIPSLFHKDFFRLIVLILFLSCVLLQFEADAVKDALIAMIVGNLCAILVLHEMQIGRQYAETLSAFSTGILNYAVALPLMIARSRSYRFLALLLLFLIYVYTGVTFSGKLILSVVVVAYFIFLGERNIQQLSVKRLLSLVLSISFILLFFHNIDTLSTFLIEREFLVFGHKLKQINVISNLALYAPEIVFLSSGGNIIAEFLTICLMLLGQIDGYLPFVGVGLGGGVSDVTGFLSLANKDAYPEAMFLMRKFSGFHLSFFVFVMWFGIFGIIYVAYWMGKILLVAERWQLVLFMLSLLFYLMVEKFDPFLLGIITASVFNKMKNS